MTGDAPEDGRDLEQFRDYLRLARARLEVGPESDDGGIRGG